MLAGLAVLSLALVPIHITTIYSGLPAHPLFLHVPVILIPVAMIWALVLVARPAWFMRSGVLLGILTVVALAGTFLTVGAGEALRNALHLNGGFGPGALIARHAHAGMLLRDLMILFTGAVIVALFAHRVAAGMVSGFGWLDGARAPTGRADPPAHRARGPGDPVRVLRVPRRRPRGQGGVAGAAVRWRCRAAAADP